MNLARSTLRATVNFLFSAWLQKNPGLTGVASALRLYREKMTGAVASEDAFHSLDWLNKMEEFGFFEQCLANENYGF